MNKIKALSISSILLLALACNKTDLSSVDNNSGQEVYLDLPDKPYRYFQSSQYDNKATLGRVLFYDNHLSINNAISCASCHKQQLAFADDVAFSRGFENRLTGRNSMALQDFSSGSTPFSFGNQMFFWDGRSQGLNDLIKRPITNHVEMGIDDISELPQKLSALGYYDDLFLKAYSSKEITVEKISESVMMFLTSIRANHTRFDDNVKGAVALTAREEHGRNLFNVKYGCNKCHMLQEGAYGSSTIEFINIGLSNTGDNGRSTITRNSADRGKFKIPNLRNVALTAPYMHDGRFETLEDVIEHYSSGIENDANLDMRLRDNNGKPMKMNISDDEKQAIVAFLSTLTDYQMITDVKYSNPFKLK